MTKLRYFHITFNTQIQPWEIPLFRGAIIQKVGLEHEWYHNHNNSTSNKPAFHYRYPLIQYKTNHRKQPMIVCLHKSIEEIQLFFQQEDWNIHLKGKEKAMKVHELLAEQYDLQIHPQSTSYQIRNWIALNQENFRTYKSIQSLTKKITFLESKLIGHILAFATGVDWQIQEKLKVEITELTAIKTATYKGQHMETFSLSFLCNAFLPNHIGLGKGSSMGFGIIKRHP
ncbi:MAG: CRISPR-associated endonuclease Cas6 [Chitinophagales bacterium]